MNAARAVGGILLHYLCSAINSWRRSALAPIKRSTTAPPLMNKKVGMADTLYLPAVSGFSSTSTFKKTTSGMLSLSSANCQE